MVFNKRMFDSLGFLVVCLGIMVILIVTLPNRSPTRPVTPPTQVPAAEWWDAAENLTDWDDAEWEMAIWCVDNWDDGWKCVFGMGDHLDDARWAEHRGFIAGLFVHSDERVRAAAVWLLAQRGESYDAFRQDESKFVQDTIIRWDTGELPSEYNYLGG